MVEREIGSFSAPIRFFHVHKRLAILKQPTHLDRMQDGAGTPQVGWGVRGRGGRVGEDTERWRANGGGCGALRTLVATAARG